MSENEATTFFRLVYDGAPGWVTVFALPGERTSWIRAGDVAGAVQAAMRESAAGRNVYANVGTQRERLTGGRGGAGTVCALTGLWADVDSRGLAHASERLPPTDDDALALVAEFPLPPTLLVHSGHGLQGWWLFREPWTLDSDAEHAAAAELARRFTATMQSYAAAHGWAIDNTGDLARVLRVPGTVNRKVAGAPAPVRLLHVDEDARYTRDDLEPYLVDVDHGDGANGRTPTTPRQVSIVHELADAAEALKRLAASRADDYNGWVTVGMALSELGDAGLALWDDWSAQSAKYRPGACAAKWATFEPGHGVTLASLHHWAGQDTPAPRLVTREQPADGEEVDQGAGDQAIGLSDVVATFQRWLHMPNPNALYLALAAVVANMMPGDPVWPLIVGVPGGGKTEILQSLTGLPRIHPTATLTEGALLSGTAKREKAADAKGGLLRQIGDFGIILLKDFGSVLTINKDVRGAVLQALREIYDGSWTRQIGTDGGRTLHWQGKVGLIGGATPAIDSHHGVMAALGERFVFYRLPTLDEQEHAAGALKHLGQEQQMRAELLRAVQDLFKGVEVPPTLSPPVGAEREWLISLARLTARCRSAVIRDPYSREVEHLAGVEAPTRLTLILAKLLAALTLLGVDWQTAHTVVLKVALDSMPQLRRIILEHLAQNVGQHTTTEISISAGYPTQTTRRALEDLFSYQVIGRESGGEGKADKWQVTEMALKLYRAALTFPERLENVYTPRGDKEDGATRLKNSHYTTDSLSGKVAPAAAFVPSGDWQDLPDGYVCPAGVEWRTDFATGRNQVRWPDMAGFEEGVL